MERPSVQYTTGQASKLLEQQAALGEHNPPVTPETFIEELDYLELCADKLGMAARPMNQEPALWINTLMSDCCYRLWNHSYPKDERLKCFQFNQRLIGFVRAFSDVLHDWPKIAAWHASGRYVSPMFPPIAEEDEEETPE